MRTGLSLALLLAAPAAAQQVAPSSPTIYQRAIAAGYKALTLCSGVFLAHRTREQVEAEELAGIYPEYAEIVPGLSAEIDMDTMSVRVAWSPTLPPRRAEWNNATGCTILPIGAAETRVGGDWLAPGQRRDGASRGRWPIGDGGIAPRPSPALARVTAAAFDGRRYGAGRTVGVVVLRDGAVVAERYAGGWGPFTRNRTWSVAKSMVGTLVGIAARQDAVDVTRPVVIPEWNGDGDPRRAVTLDHLLRMGSGLHGDTAGNRTDAIYFGGTAVTEQAAGWPLEAAPGTRFRYANADILLAARSLDAILGEERYADFPDLALFRPLGMNNTTAERDWQGNYVLSSQVWSTARDLARLGQFWLQDGVWAGRRLLPEGWMRYMTTPSGPQPASGPGYGATLWLFGAAQGLPVGSYAAQGNRGQYVMVIPSRRLVIVRRGEDGGSARFDIARFAADVAEAVR